MDHERKNILNERYNLFICDCCKDNIKNAIIVTDKRTDEKAQIKHPVNCQKRCVLSIRCGTQK